MLLSPDHITPENRERVGNILEVIMSYARLDFTNKTTVTGKGDVLDALSAGVNMLGEELESSNLSLKEKEQLLKEIHHRVKNNLQIVSSLLNLQSGSVRDESFQKMIIASRNRINSMALVHEMLYSSSNLTQIDIGDYVRNLSRNIHASLSKPEANIHFSFDFQKKHYFEIDKMIPLGLIVNEVITNSIKYAFAENKGLIKISIAESEKGTVLSISDNGIGFPPGFNFERDSSLGLQLIKMLTEQLDGNLTYNFTGGASYTITF